jgi:hypothetical protein
MVTKIGLVTTKQNEIIGNQDSLDYRMSIWFTLWLKNFNSHVRQLGQMEIDFFLLPRWIISLGGDQKNWSPWKAIELNGNWFFSIAILNN